MSERRRLRLGDLLPEPRDCPFLKPEEIEALSDGVLPEERASELQKHAESCSECAGLIADVEEFRTLAEVPSSISPGERAALEAYRVGLRKEPPGGRRFRAFAQSLLGAAAVLTMVGMLWVLWQAAPDPTVETLFLEPELISLPAPPTVRGEHTASIWERVRQAEDAGDFAAMRAAVEAGGAAAEADGDLQFVLGYARIHTGDPDRAVAALERARTLQGEPPSEHTQWFLAVAHEGAGDRERACAALVEVVSAAGERAAAATALIERGCESR